MNMNGPPWKHSETSPPQILKHEPQHFKDVIVTGADYIYMYIYSTYFDPEEKIRLFCLIRSLYPAPHRFREE